MYRDISSHFAGVKIFGMPIVFVLVLLQGLVLALALSFFSTQSLRLDEAQSLWQTSHSLGRMYEIIGEDVHVPLYHTFLHFWQFLFGNDVAVARSLSLLFFLAVIPAMYLFGSYLYGPRAGMFGALLMAISPFMNWYGNEIRMYSLFTFITILNQYFFVRLYRDEKDRLPWGWYFVTAVLGIYTHYFFAFALFAQAVFFLGHRPLFPKDAFRMFVLVSVLVLLVFSPWLFWVNSLGTEVDMSPLIAPPSTVNLFNTFSQFLFGFQGDHLNSIILSFWPISVLLAFLALRRGAVLSPDTEYLLTACVVPIVAAFAASFLFRPIYLTRYLIIAIPPLYLFLAALTEAYPRKLRYVMRLGLVILMLAMLGVEMASATTPVKENYREVAAYLSGNALPQDAIVLSAPFTVYPIEYYYRGVASISTLPIWDRSQRGSIPPFEEEKLPEDAKALTRGREVLWLVLSYDQGYEETLRTYFDTNHERILVKSFSPGLSVYAYKLKYGTARKFPTATTTAQ